MIYIFGVVLPLGLWWGLMRELAGGALVACLVSHFLLEFGATLSGTLADISVISISRPIIGSSATSKSLPILRLFAVFFR